MNEYTKCLFREHLDALEANLVSGHRYLEKTKEIPKKLFTGPSLYFHRRALEECEKNFLGDCHLEMIYAVLTAWGMHRMGEESHTKIIKFDGDDGFSKRIRDVATKHGLEKYQQNKSAFAEVSVENIVNPIFDLKINTASNACLTASSKVLHHIVPVFAFRWGTYKKVYGV